MEEKLSDWLKNNGFGSFIAKLVKQDLSLSDLRSLDNNDLIELGTSIGMPKLKAKAFANKLSPLAAVNTQVKPQLNEAMIDSFLSSSFSIDQILSMADPSGLLKEEIKSYVELRATTLNEAEKDAIIAFVNEENTLEEILQNMKVAANSIKGDLITDYINTRIKSKPFPTNRTQLVVKTSGDKLPVYHYYSKEDPCKKYYTFLVIGETGTGKTTLLDAFVNYLCDMKYTDLFRWKLVNENTFKGKHGSCSQTTDITYYYVSDEREDSTGEKFHVRIIDSPGFGDTEGVTKDNRTIKQFEQLFKDVGTLDYILITVKAGETRWTPGNRYVYDRVQEIFGTDAKDRFVLMCTFADGGIPIAVETLRPHLMFEKYFTFNNSALYTPPNKGTSQTRFFWKLGIQSVVEFRNFVVKENRKPMSLTLSSEVIATREYLYAYIASTQAKIAEGFRQLESLKILCDQIQQNRKKIDENGSFEYWEDVPKYVRIPLNDTYQLCSICQTTCCQFCSWPANATESQCSYFRNNNPCPICKNHCPKSAHIRTKEQVTITTQREKKIFFAKQAAFEEGQSGLSASQLALKEKRSAMTVLAQEILSNMKLVKINLAKLDEIAMKPRVFTDEEYFKEMINHEKDKKTPGWSVRVAGLEAMLERAKHIREIQSATSANDMFPQYAQVINEMSRETESESVSTNSTTNGCTVS